MQGKVHSKRGRDWPQKRWIVDRASTIIVEAFRQVNTRLTGMKAYG